MVIPYSQDKVYESVVFIPYLVDADSKKWLKYVIHHVEWHCEWILENMIEKIGKSKKVHQKL